MCWIGAECSTKVRNRNIFGRLRASFVMRSAGDASTMAAFPLLDLPYELKRRTASFLSSGDAVRMSVACKSVRSCAAEQAAILAMEVLTHYHHYYSSTRVSRSLVYPLANSLPNESTPLPRKIIANASPASPSSVDACIRCVSPVDGKH